MLTHLPGKLQPPGWPVISACLIITLLVPGFLDFPCVMPAPSDKPLSRKPWVNSEQWLWILEFPISSAHCLTLLTGIEAARRPTRLPTGLARVENQFAVSRGQTFQKMDGWYNRSVFNNSHITESLILLLKNYALLSFLLCQTIPWRVTYWTWHSPCDLWLIHISSVMLTLSFNMI